MARPRRKFSKEFKAEAVKTVKEGAKGGKSIGQVAEDLDLTETSLRDWVKRHDIDAGNGPPGALTTAEREELRRLRKENLVLRKERDLLKKATAFFAKEKP
jgi:transposase